MDAWDNGNDRVFRVDVDRDIRRNVGPVAELRVSNTYLFDGGYSTSLGTVRLEVGDRIGATFDANDREINPCSLITPDAVEAALGALPSPRSGRAAFLLRQAMPDVRTVAVSETGEVLAYGTQPGTVAFQSACSGGRRVAELVTFDDSRGRTIRTSVAMRDTRTFEVMWTRDLADERGARPGYPLGIVCRDRRGMRATVALGYGRHEVADISLHAVRRGSAALLYRGPGREIHVAGPFAFVVDRPGTSISKIDLESGSIVGDFVVGLEADDVAVSPEGRHVASFSRATKTSEVLLTLLNTERGTILRRRIPGSDRRHSVGKIVWTFWLSSDRFIARTPKTIWSFGRDLAFSRIEGAIPSYADPVPAGPELCWLDPEEHAAVSCALPEGTPRTVSLPTLIDGAFLYAFEPASRPRVDQELARPIALPLNPRSHPEQLPIARRRGYWWLAVLAFAAVMIWMAARRLRGERPRG